MKHPNNFRNISTFVLFVLFFSCILFLFQYIRTCRKDDCLPSISQINYSGNPEFSFDLRYVEENLNSLAQDDPHLIRYTRVKYLTPPSKQPYNLKFMAPRKTALANWVMKIFGNKTNGIFIEAGANDGESNSNTIYFEKELGWTGLLVECNPKLVPHVLTKHRKVWVADVCLSTSATPGIFNFSLPVDFDVAGTIGRVMDMDKNRTRVYFDVQAIPLYSILSALDMKEIDYFSFDIEGAELGVLRYFPFDKVTFKVIVIEHHYYNEDEKKELKEIFARNDYIFVMMYHIDYFFVHNSMKHLIPK